jgi:hypothetical protein
MAFLSDSVIIGTKEFIAQATSHSSITFSQKTIKLPN